MHAAGTTKTLSALAHRFSTQRPGVPRVPGIAASDIRLTVAKAQQLEAAAAQETLRAAQRRQVQERASADRFIQKAQAKKASAATARLEVQRAAEAAARKEAAASASSAIFSRRASSMHGAALPTAGESRLYGG
jgi:hypothetical protein